MLVDCVFGIAVGLAVAEFDGLIDFHYGDSLVGLAGGVKGFSVFYSTVSSWT